MSRTSRSWLGVTLAPLAAAGCMAYPATPGTGVPQALPAPAGIRLAVTIRPPAARGLKVVSPYRWTATDVYRYDVSLKSTFGGVSVLVLPTVELFPGEDPPETTATFSGLVAGRMYSVEVVAYGNEGGTDGEEVLNSLTPSVTPIDLTGANPVLADTLEATATVVLDPIDVDFPIGLDAPTEDGVYEDPDDPEVLIATPVGS